MKKLIKKRINKIASVICKEHQREIKLKGEYGGATLPTPLFVYVDNYGFEVGLMIFIITLCCFTTWTGLLVPVQSYLEANFGLQGMYIFLFMLVCMVLATFLICIWCMCLAVQFTVKWGYNYSCYLEENNIKLYED